MSRYLFMPVLWFWLVLGLLILVIRQVPPFSAVATDKLILVVEESKLFFLSVLIPLALTKNTLQEKLNKTDTVGHLVAFILLSLPLTILASYFSYAAFSALLRSHLLLILIAATMVLLCTKFPGRITAYYLAFFILFGALPILYYLVLEFTQPLHAGAGLTGIMITINPFYLFWKIKAPGIFYSTWFYNCLLWLMAIVLLAFIRPTKPESKNYEN